MIEASLPTQIVLKGSKAPLDANFQCDTARTNVVNTQQSDDSDEENLLQEDQKKEIVSPKKKMSNPLFKSSKDSLLEIGGGSPIMNDLMQDE